MNFGHQNLANHRLTPTEEYSSSQTTPTQEMLKHDDDLRFTPSVQPSPVLSSKEKTTFNHELKPGKVIRQVNPKRLLMKRAESAHRDIGHILPLSPTTAESPTNLLRYEDTLSPDRTISNDSPTFDGISLGEKDFFLKKINSTPTEFGELDNLMTKKIMSDPTEEFNEQRIRLRPPTLDDYTFQELKEDLTITEILKMEPARYQYSSQKFKGQTTMSKELQDNWRISPQIVKESVGLNIKIEENKTVVNKLSPRCLSENVSNPPTIIENQQVSGLEHEPRNENIIRPLGLNLTNIPPNQNQDNNPAQNVRENESTNIQQTSPSPSRPQQTQPQLNILLLREPQVKIYLRRKIAFFVASMFVSLFLWLMVHNIVTYRSVFTALYSYFVYLVVENMMGARQTQPLENWQKNESRLNVFTSLAYILTLLFFDLKLANILPECVYSSFPLMFTTPLVYFKSFAPEENRATKALMGIVNVKQIFFITLRVDGVIICDWKIILIGCWILLSIIVVYFVAYGSLTVSIGFTKSLLQRYRERNLTRNLQTFGLFWYSLYYSLGLVAIGILYGLCDAFNSNRSFTILNIAAIVSFVINLFLVILTLLTFKQMTKFIRTYFQTRSLAGTLLVRSVQPPKRVVISFEVEKKDTDFLMISSTYFLPLTRKFFAKNKEYLERIKDIFYQFRLGKPIAFGLSKDDKKDETKMKIEAFQQDKKSLDIKLNKLLDKDVNSEKYTNKNCRISNIMSSRDQYVNMKGKEESNLVEDLENQTSICKKLNLSVDNINNLEKQAVYAIHKDNQDENLCYLCYNDVPDSVLMTCGHGGICYNCATSLVKSKNECMECRSQVKAIYKINLNSKISNIVKSAELSKVVVNSPAV